MAFRERIEAVLKVKDAARFKSALGGAARSVRKLGKDEAATAATTELLESILSKLEHQTERSALATEGLAHSIDQLGDQMTQTAAKSVVMNAAMKKSGSNAVFLGKSWAFWKDRLSLTRSEIMTTAITISVYFAPAIVALGSSFANAAIGGGAVAGAGLSSLLFGLGLMATLVKPLANDIKKVTAAQQQYNIAVRQYGAASIQTSRASAHLGAVIGEHGGRQTVQAINALKGLSKTWAKFTKPGKSSLLDILMGGTGSLRAVLPTLAKITNAIAKSLFNALQPAFRAFTGPDIQKGIGALGRIFTKSIGPGVQGAVNLIEVFARIIRASAPYVIKWAKAWQATTARWKESTSDQKRVKKFIDSAVHSFKLWWGLAKELGNTLKIIFGVSKSEGDKVVVVLTNGVKALNDWLTQMRDTGAITSFWQTYNKSITDAFNLMKHPEDWAAAAINAINKWLPPVMDAIATQIGTHGPTAAWKFLDAFIHANAWVHFFGILYLTKKLGVFKALGKALGAMFLTPFIEAFIPGFLATFGISVETGSIAATMTAAGTTAGGAFGLAFQIAMIAALTFGVYKFYKWLKSETEKQKKLRAHLDKTRKEKGVTPYRASRGGPTYTRQTHGGATGGVLPFGLSSLVGENGPEIASAGPRGTKIIPLRGNSRHTLPGAMDVPSLENAINLHVMTSVQIDKREIARAYNTELARVTGSRGGRPPQTQIW